MLKLSTGHVKSVHCYEGDCCLRKLERAYRQGKNQFIMRISCAL
jgi:hypothetical protein